MVHNNNCDGSHCQSATGEVRRLSTRGDGAVILCYDCYRYEIQYRRERNLELADGCKFDLPSWRHLEVYPND